MPDDVTPQNPDPAIQPASPPVTVSAPDAAAPQPAPAQPAAQPVQAPAAHPSHIAALGHGISALLGKQYDYVPDAQGNLKPVAMEQKPGDIWRHIVAGAILGGAAASREHVTSPAAGFAVGGEASIRENQRQDEARRAAAGQNFQRQQEAQRTKVEQDRLSLEDRRLQEEVKMHEATEAHLVAADLRSAQEFNLHEQEYFDHRNDVNKENFVRNQEAGGSLVPNIPGNGEIGKHAELQSAIAKNPALIKAAPGYFLSETHTVDTSGLKQDPKKGWVDEKGNKVDLDDRTTWNIQQIPIDGMKKIKVYTGAELMRLYPHAYRGLDPKANYPISLEETKNLALSEHTMQHQDWEEKQKSRHEAGVSAVRASKVRHDNLMGELRAIDPMDPQADAKRQAISKRLDIVIQQYDEAIQKMFPGTAPEERLRNPLKGEGESEPQANDAVVDQAFSAIRNLSTDQQLAAIQSSARLTPEQKKALTEKVKAGKPAASSDAIDEAVKLYGVNTKNSDKSGVAPPL